LQLIVKCASKAGADQEIELLIFEKFSHALPANTLSDACMKDLNFPISDNAANYPDAITNDAGLVAQTVQEI
jgi:hypothetical protein